MKARGSVLAFAAAGLVALFLTCAAVAEEKPAAPSIFEFIQTHRDARTGQLSPEGMTLPDESTTRRFGGMRWAPGALEGLGTRHMEWDGSVKAYQAVLLLEEIAAGNEDAETALYDMLRADDVVTFYNDALDFAAARIRSAEPELHDLARRLVTTARDRGPVKFGIAMLGSMGDEKDLELVRTLALHDEFGLYAAEAIAELAPRRQEALYEMAKRVNGWGRIEAVALMTSTGPSDLGTDSTPNARIRRWLLTEGFRNDVTAQYLAYHCATIADLADALEETEKQKDVAFLSGVSDLVQSLVKSGPSSDPQIYPDAPKVAISFLRQIQRDRSSIGFLLAAQTLNDAAVASEWSAEEKQEVQQLAAPILADRKWRKRVLEAVADDRGDLEQAETAARKLDIPTFEVHLRRLSKNGAVAERWRIAFMVAEPRQVQPLLHAAERAFGPRFEKDGEDRAGTSDAALEAVLQGVAKYPGSGIPIVDASLMDISPNVRRAAVDTLVRWGGAYVQKEPVRTALREAAAEETDETLKARMVALLNAGALP